MEAWKLVKRQKRWFAKGKEDPKVQSRERSGLELRQGFFSFARSLSTGRMVLEAEKLELRRTPRDIREGV